MDGGGRQRERVLGNGLHHISGAFVVFLRTYILTLVNCVGLQTSHSTTSAPWKNCPYNMAPSFDSTLDLSRTSAIVLYPCRTLSRTVDFPIYPVAPAMTAVFISIEKESAWPIIENKPTMARTATLEDNPQLIMARRWEEQRRSRLGNCRCSQLDLCGFKWNGRQAVHKVESNRSTKDRVTSTWNLIRHWVVCLPLLSHHYDSWLHRLESRAKPEGEIFGPLLIYRYLCM